MFNLPQAEDSLQGQPVETRPKATAEWLALLPLASPADSAQQLITTLHRLNRQPLSADDRHTLMALYRPVVQSVAASLETLLTDAGVPPHAQQRQTGVLLRELFTEHSVGYKQLLMTLMNRRFGRPSAKLLAEASAHLLNALRDIQIACYLTYCSVPRGLWLDMHQVYELAQSTGLADSATDTYPAASQIYRQALLLALADPPHMSRAEFAYTRMYLNLMSKLAELKPASADPVENGFIVALDQDCGPGQLTGQSKKPLWLDTDALCRQLHETAASLRSGSSPQRLGLPQGMDSSMGLSLGKRLIKQWRTGAQRAFKRYPSTNASMQLVAGVSAIHRLLELVPQAPQFEADPDADLAVHDVGHTFAAPAAVNATHWNVSNDSAAGLALNGAPDTPLNLRVGDALAMRPDDAATWSLAVIRWIKMQDARQIELGIERLSPQIKPVWVRPLRGSRKASPEPALLVPGLPTLKQPDRLLLPRNLYQVGMDAEVWHAPRQYTLTFGQRLERTPGFDLIDFTIFADEPIHS